MVREVGVSQVRDDLDLIKQLAGILQRRDVPEDFSNPRTIRIRE